MKEKRTLEYKKLMNKVVDIPMFINGKNVKSNKTRIICPLTNTSILLENITKEIQHMFLKQLILPRKRKQLGIYGFLFKSIYFFKSRRITFWSLQTKIKCSNHGWTI